MFYLLLSYCLQKLYKQNFSSSVDLDFFLCFSVPSIILNSFISLSSFVSVICAILKAFVVCAMQTVAFSCSQCKPWQCNYWQADISNAAWHLSYYDGWGSSATVNVSIYLLSSVNIVMEARWIYIRSTIDPNTLITRLQARAVWIEMKQNWLFKMSVAS